MFDNWADMSLHILLAVALSYVTIVVHGHPRAKVSARTIVHVFLSLKLHHKDERVSAWMATAFTASATTLSKRWDPSG